MGVFQELFDELDESEEWDNMTHTDDEDDTSSPPRDSLRSG